MSIVQAHGIHCQMCTCSFHKKQYRTWSYLIILIFSFPHRRRCPSSPLDPGKMQEKQLSRHVFWWFPSHVKMQVLHYGTLWDMYGRLWDIYGFRTGFPKCRFCRNMGFVWEEYGILWVIMGFVWEEYGIPLISQLLPTNSDEILIKMFKLRIFCISTVHSDLVVSIRNSELKF